MKTLRFHFLFILFSFLIISCGDDDGNDGKVDCNDSFSISQELNDELNAINLATNTYVNDQSAANCTALKSAFQDYLNALMAIQDCAEDVGQGAEFQQALQDAQQGIDDLQC